MNYNSLDSELKRRFGKKVYRLPLDAGCTCPNRDGKCGFGGCIFCASGAYPESSSPISEQIEAAKNKVKSKTKDNAYIAYFQSHTSTYGNPETLKPLFYEAINHPDVVALSVGTRPDCLSDDWIGLLSELNKIKPVWVELGLQTIHDETAKLINRGYPLEVFEDTYARLKNAGIEVIVHIIAGLPEETNDMVKDTVKYLARLSPTLDGIKIQNLNVLKGTPLAEMYTENPHILHIYEMEEYLSLVVELIALLPRETVVHRVTGDGPRSLLIAPLWITDKKRVLNTFRKMIEEKEP